MKPPETLLRIRSLYKAIEKYEQNLEKACLYEMLALYGAGSASKLRDHLILAQCQLDWEIGERWIEICPRTVLTACEVFRGERLNYHYISPSGDDYHILPCRVLAVRDARICASLGEIQLGSFRDAIADVAIDHPPFFSRREP